MNGLQMTLMLAGKNALLLVAECALMHYGEAGNPVTTMISKLLSFLPGADRLDKEIQKEKRNKELQEREEQKKRNKNKEDEANKNIAEKEREREKEKEARQKEANENAAFVA